jgi:glyceraldehyde-3-phosphate dehydrogenase/erythrose-4-phosphate dehydrogenase
MATRVGINGFGRIGRQSLKALLERAPDVEVVAVNDLVDPKMNAHLFKHDSTYGAYPGDVRAGDASIIVDGREIKILAERDPAALPWGDLGVDIVLESTGIFTENFAQTLDQFGIPRGRQSDSAHCGRRSVVAHAYRSVRHLLLRQSEFLVAADVKAVDAAQQIDFLLRRHATKNGIHALFDRRI